MVHINYRFLRDCLLDFDSNVLKPIVLLQYPEHLLVATVNSLNNVTEMHRQFDTEIVRTKQLCNISNNNLQKMTITITKVKIEKKRKSNKCFLN